MSYLVLARKYRPQSFDDLVGQEHVAKTLANAISLGRVAHAFLFTGVRGVGKTTSARLLAKCLNCLGADGDGTSPATPERGQHQKATGPTSTPCQVCAACTEIAAGIDMDVQEIDGASYNGVDEVRRLQEGLAFRPARDRFKIYIVDEVHMLSNAAWNAFLKTLEEPPPHVKFIFATTEVHKVPVTILSRCQRYDFKLLPTQMIAKRLGQVLAQESIKAEDAAVAILAREAAGSMRDAMSLLDQVIAFSGDKLSAEDVARVLGVADRRVLHDLSAAIMKGDPLAALKVIDGVSQQGYDIAHTARDLLRHFRDLVVAKVGGEGARELLDLADEEVADVVALAQSAELDDLTRVYQGFSRAFDDMVKAVQPRAAFEMLLVRLARRPPLLPLDELLSRVGDLEKRLTAGGGPPAPGPRGGGGARTTATSVTSDLRVGSTRRDAGPDFQVPSDISPEPRGPRASAAEPTRAGVAMAAPVRRAAQAAEPWEAPYPGAHGALALAVAPAPQAPGLAAVPSPEPQLEPQPTRASLEHVGPLVHTVSEADFATYRTIVERVRNVKAGFAALFENAVVVEIGKERLRVAFEANSFLSAQASDPEALDVLMREARAHFAAVTSVEVEQTKASLAGKATLAALNAQRNRERLAAARAKVLAHPLVDEAMRLFDAKAEVRLPNED